MVQGHAGTVENIRRFEQKEPVLTTGDEIVASIMPEPSKDLICNQFDTVALKNNRKQKNDCRKLVLRHT